MTEQFELEIIGFRFTLKPVSNETMSEADLDIYQRIKERWEQSVKHAMQPWADPRSELTLLLVSDRTGNAQHGPIAPASSGKMPCSK